MSDTCEDGYYCDDSDCECASHLCSNHEVDLRECEENDRNGATEGICLYCLFEGSRFDLLFPTHEDPERILEISRHVINVGFFDYMNGKKPEIVKVHKSARKIVDLYLNGKELAKSVHK